MPAIRIYTVDEAKQTILKRRRWDEWPIPDRVREGIRQVFGEELTPEEAVRRIVQDVRERGDAALREWTERADRVTPAYLEVSLEEIEAAYDQVSPDVVSALEFAAGRIERFHRKQPITSWLDWQTEGGMGQMVRPLQRAGLYVPGGTAPLPSTVLMTAIPAKVAGVDEVIVCTPPRRSDGRVAPVTLVAADIAGVDRIFAVGGAQAIAAMAYGTETIPAVDKIVGPGNLFVTLAKKHVFGDVGIEGLLGPTETVIIADETANPAWVAADLLAQAEHDVLATAILLTPNRTFAGFVQKEVEKQLDRLERADIIREALAHQGGIVITRDLAEAVELANDFAPEHLCLSMVDPWDLVGAIRNAGGVFVGEFSFEVLGDYVAGPSHSMPTGGSARFASPVNVLDFVKITSVVALNEGGMESIAEAAEILAQAEGLTAHAHAARIRRKGDLSFSLK
ncbi:MAG: histidinol dehydrogenase [Chloroflexi bacterium]|nr:histidinol dehydrogenase [Chloroflexota bacterium]